MATSAGIGSLRHAESRSNFGKAVVGLVALLAAGSTAAAADASGAASSGGSGEELQEITITGSLFVKPNDVASSPIVVTSTKDIQQSGQVSFEDALNQLPEFTPSGNSATGGQGIGGHATINLHGLGADRNLVLLDGRRLPLADIFGDVDINLIPTSVISSVETITGGASAVYGSDAMSGVVNFKTLQNFEGVAADVQYGNSFREDYEQVNGSVAFGTKFGEGKGHLLVSFGYTYDQGLQGSKRSFFDNQTPSSYIGQDTFVPSAANLPNQAVLNGLFASYGVSKHVPNTLNLGFNNNGSLFAQTGAINYQGPVNTRDFAILGGNVRMPVAPQTYIENPLNRRSIFSKFDYEITPGVTAYGQVLYNDWDVYTSSGKSLTQFGTLTTIPVTNPFIPADLATLLASRPSPDAPFTWNGRYVGLPAKAWDEHYTTDQFIGGLRGTLPVKNWTWDIYTAYDSTQHLQSNYNAVLKSQVQNLLNSPNGGASICAGGFNPFGLADSSNISGACQQYMTTTAHSTEQLSQSQVQGVIQGSLFSLPAGDVDLALLGDHRRNSYIYHPDSQLAAQNIEAVVASQPTSGSISVSEVAAQLDVPVLRDLPLVKKLNLGGAYRYSKYDTSGGVSTYAGDVKWTPIESMLVRAGYQRAVRAPNIGELFSAASGAQIAFGTPPVSIGDPCDIRSTGRTGANGAKVAALCEAQGIPAAVIGSYEFPTTATAGVTQGNPALTPETASTYNFGLVWTSHAESPWLSDFSASADYYNISIKNVISVIPGLTALSKCYNLDGSNPTYSATNPYCALIERDPTTGQLNLINTPYLNLGGLKTDGVDGQISWGARLSDIGWARAIGKIDISSGVGYTRDYLVETLPNTGFLNFAGTNTANGATDNPTGSFPHWKALTSIAYEVGPVTAGMRWRYQDAMRDVASVTSPSSPGLHVPVYNVFDLFTSWDVNKTWHLRGGITNMFNRGLPIVSSSQTGTDAAVFDAVGRAYYVGLRLSL